MVLQCRQQKSTGSLFQTYIEDLDTGLYSHLWQHPFPSYSNWSSQHSYVYHACEYNYQNEINIHIQHAVLKPNRERESVSVRESAMMHGYNSTTSFIGS